MTMTRDARGLISLCTIVLITLLAPAAAFAAPTSAPSSAEQWGIFELSLPGPADGNPFVDTTLTARFTNGDKSVDVHGFYDGDGVYRVRLMPEVQGTWKYKTASNRPELNDQSGQFTCTKPSPGNHGPVHVSKVFHWGYADGTPHISIGTTSYSWAHQKDEMRAKTIETLKSAPFTKIRMCALPTRQSRDEPILFPFAPNTSATQAADRAKFNVEFFRNFERCVSQMREARADEETEIWLRRLRDEAFVEIRM